MANKPVRVKGCCGLPGCGTRMCNGAKNDRVVLRERKATGQRRRFTQTQDGW